ncbi:MAG: hydroxyethylthiazole kinase [Myxococcota bacterium]
MELNEQLILDLKAIREKKPLIHHITNFVVMNQTANVTLAIGAQPVMAHAIDEVEEMASFAGALLLNIGTLWRELIDSMLKAGKKANQLGVPVVLDPVGAGATKLRIEATKRILGEVKVDILRANLAEALSCADIKADIIGVDSRESEAAAFEKANEAARKLKTTIAVTGKTDIIIGGGKTLLCDNGDALLGRVTGTGCSASTSVACFAAVEKDFALAASFGIAYYALAGELAAKEAKGVGSFETVLRDKLFTIGEKEIKEHLKLKNL